MKQIYYYAMMEAFGVEPGMGPFNNLGFREFLAKVFGFDGPFIEKIIKGSPELDSQESLWNVDSPYKFSRSDWAKGKLAELNIVTFQTKKVWRGDDKYTLVDDTVVVDVPHGEVIEITDIVDGDLDTVNLVGENSVLDAFSKFIDSNYYKETDKIKSLVYEFKKEIEKNGRW